MMTFRESYLYLSDIAHLSSKTDSCVHGNGFGHWHLPAIVGSCSDLSVLCSKYPFQTDFISTFQPDEVSYSDKARMCCKAGHSEEEEEEINEGTQFG